MAIAAGTNCITKAEDSLKTMIAASASFQSWVTGYNAAHVPVDHVHIDFLPMPGFVIEGADGPRKDVYEPSELEELGRHALIGTDFDGGENAYEHDSTSHAYEHLPKGQIWCEFKQIIDPRTDKLNEESRKFKNTWGEVIEQVLAIANVDSNLSIVAAMPQYHGLNQEDKYPTVYQELLAQCLFLYDFTGG